jgi:hypothetical protein
MPTFHFNIGNAQGLIPNQEGVDLPDSAAARKEAQVGARAAFWA